MPKVLTGNIIKAENRTSAITFGVSKAEIESYQTLSDLIDELYFIVQDLIGIWGL